MHQRGSGSTSLSRTLRHADSRNAIIINKSVTGEETRHSHQWRTLSRLQLRFQIEERDFSEPHKR